MKDASQQQPPNAGIVALKAAMFSRSSETWRPIAHTRNTRSTGVLRRRNSGKLLQPERARNNRDQNASHIHKRIRQSHQIAFTIHSPAFQIYPNLYFISMHVSDAEVFSRRLIGTCIRRDLNYSTSHPLHIHIG